MHLLFGDAPYLYAVTLRRRTRSPGQWHARMRLLRAVDGSERVLLFCGLKKFHEVWDPGLNLAGERVSYLNVTRMRNVVTCSKCSVAFDRYLEQGSAALKRTPKGPWAHLLFKPTAVHIASVISQDEPGARAS